MIRSMTAFARQERSGPWGSLTLEVRSVNHRYLELAPRIPEELRVLEPQVRERLGARLGRGKVDLYLRFRPPEAAESGFTVNRELAKHVAQTSREVDGMLYNPAPINSLDVMRWPGVLQTPEADLEQLGGETLALLDATIEDLVAVREREGDKLAGIIAQRCSAMQEVVAEVRDMLPSIIEHWREKLRARISELQAEVDEQRIEQEIAILAQKMDVDEELDRLRTHLEEVGRLLKQDKPVGRRLDFLMQELNREANTLGSKSYDARSTRASVDLKVLIEQMREQVQNIE